MSGAWSGHMDMVNRLLAENKAKRAARLGTATTARNAAAAGAAVQPAAAVPWAGGLDQWQGGANMADPFGPGQPGDLSALGDRMGINTATIGGLLGSLGGGLAFGPFGGLAGALAGRGIAGLLSGGDAGSAGAASDAASAAGGSANSAAAGYGGGYGTGPDGWGGLMSGGYTGAGDDGIVQPHRVAKKFVHEGEIVIPHHVVKRLGLLGR